MSEKFIKDDDDEEESPEVQKSSNKKTLILVGAFLVFAVAIVIIFAAVVISKGSKLNFKKSTVEFEKEIIYLGSHYNYQNQLVVIYQKNSGNNYFVGIADEDGDNLKQIYEFKEGELNDLTFINRASSFSDGKRLLIAGKILECSSSFSDCKNTKIYDIEFPEEVKKIKNLLYLYTEPIVDYNGNYIFWSSFDNDMNAFNFYGELKFEDNKYKIINARGISNFFYDLYNKETGTFSLPKILRNGPIKQLIDGGKGLSIAGFLNYGLRKGINQSLQNDELEPLSLYEGYEGDTIISPDSELAAIMTTRFSPNTSLDIIGFIPTPYSIIPSYYVSNDLYMFSEMNIRKDSTKKANLGPALVELANSKKDKDYKGRNLTNEDNNWIFNGFISWAQDNLRFMFDEVDKTTGKKRCQIVELTNYKPDKKNIEQNFNGSVPYSRSIEETINLHLDFPINITVNGTYGNLEIFHNETKCEVKYNNFTEDNKTTYNGIYSYEKFSNYSIFIVNIESKGEKNGTCDYRLWFDKIKNIYLFDAADDGKNKSYGGCNYDGKEIKVDIYQYEIINNK